MAAQRKLTLGTSLIAGLLLVFCWKQLNASSFVGTSTGKVRQLKRVARGPVDKKMKDRIASVQKTGKLTDAMRLVAAAKVRRAQDGVTKARPFSDELQGMIKGLVKKLKGSGLEAELPMLRVPEKVTNVGIVVISGDRGLCGPYNSYVTKRAAARITELNDQGITPKLILVGKKSVIAQNQRWSGLKFETQEKTFRMPDTVTSAAAGEIAEEMKNLFLSGEVDKVEIIYGKFFTLLKNEATVRTVLPLSPTGMDTEEDETFRMTSEDGKLKVEKEKVKAAKAKEIEPDVIFDQPPEVILNSMLPLYLNSQLLSILFDAQASELSSRMTAMKAATDNAADLVDKLTLAFNKKRQAAITQEICEISAGALCLEDGDKEMGGPKLGIFDNEDTISEDFLKEIESGEVPEEPVIPEEMADLPAFAVNDPFA